MKNFYLIIFISYLSISCSVTIPPLANLDDKITLLAKNKDLDINYNLQSDINDGFITFTYVNKESIRKSQNEKYEYASKTVFKKIWKSYFDKKYNDNSENKIKIDVKLEDLYLERKNRTSKGKYLLTGNTKYIVNAVGNVSVRINYQSEEYSENFEIVTSDFNESQVNNFNGYSISSNRIDPSQQYSILLENCFNKMIIEVDNYINTVLIK